MTLSLRLRTLELAAPRPVRHRARLARRGPPDHDGRRGAARRRRTAPTGRSASARATRTRTTARRRRRWPRSRRCCSRRWRPSRRTCAAPVDDVRAALEDAEGLMAAAIGHHGAIKCAIDIALHDLAGKRLGLPVRELLGRRAAISADGLHARASTTPAVVAERARRAARLPGAQDQGGRPVRPRDARGRARRVRRARSASTPTPAGRRRARVALLPELVRLGVELIEQPFPARRLDQLRWLQERSRAADRRRRERGDRSRTSTRSWASSPGVNVKLAKCGGVGPGAADAGAGAGARLPDVPRLHGGDVDRDRGVGRGRRRSPSGWTSTAACCSRTTRSTGLEIGPDKRWRLPDRPGLGLELRPDARPCRAPHRSAVRAAVASTGFGGSRGLSTACRGVWTSRWATWWRSPYRQTPRTP